MQKWFQKIVLFLAVITVMGHNVLPHHHHEDVHGTLQHDHHEKQGVGHHHQDGEQDNDEDEDSLPLGDFNHSPEFGKVITKPASFNDFSLKVPSEAILLQVYLLWLGVKSLPIIRPPIENHGLSSSVFCHCLPLRAPPALS